MGHGNWRALHVEMVPYGSRVKTQPQKYKLYKDALREMIRKYKERQYKILEFRSYSDESDDDGKQGVETEDACRVMVVAPVMVKVVQMNKTNSKHIRRHLHLCYE